MGRPWIFRDIDHFLKTGEMLPHPEVAEIRDVLLGHLDDLYAFYGAERGSRVARKHIAWYTRGLRNSALFRARMNQLQSAGEQVGAVRLFFDGLLEHSPRLEYSEAGCIFFWLRRSNGQPERLRLVIPESPRESGWIMLRLDTLPLAEGAVELHHCRMATRGGPDERLDSAAVLHAMKP